MTVYPPRRPALPEQSVQVLQADERQRWAGLPVLPLDQQLPGTPCLKKERRSTPACLSAILSVRQTRKKMVKSTMKKMVGDPGRVEARVCVVCRRDLLVSS